MIFNSYIYFYHLEKYCILPDYPESLSDSLKATFSEENALARTAPVFSYNNSGPRTVSTVSLTLHRDMMEGLNFNVSNLKDNVVDFTGEDYIDVLLKYLQAAALPRYNEYSSGSKTVIPPMVAIRFGNDIFIKGVVTGNVAINYRKPILWNDKYAVADISFSVSEVDPYDADTVVEEGSFRGVVRAFKDGIYKDTTASPTIAQSASTTSQVKANNQSEDLVSLKRDIKVKKTKKTNTQTTKYKLVQTGVDGPPPSGGN